MGPPARGNYLDQLWSLSTGKESWPRRAIDITSTTRPQDRIDNDRRYSLRKADLRVKNDVPVWWTRGHGVRSFVAQLGTCFLRIRALARWSHWFGAFCRSVSPYSQLSSTNDRK